MDDFAKELDARTIRFERLLPGPIERVWAYLYDSEKRGEWFASGAMPAKAGEKFEMHYRFRDYSPHKSTPPERMREMDEKGKTGTYTLLACEPPHRLAFTFGKGDLSDVEFRLTPEGDKVRMVLTHSRIPDRDFKLSVSGGWQSHLEILRDKLEGRVPPGFWDVWRKYDGAYETRYG